MKRRVRIASLLAYSLLGAVFFTRGAEASRPRMHLQDVDTSNFAAHGEIRLVGSLVELEGEPIGDRGAQAFHLVLSGVDVGAPAHVTRSEGTREPLDLVLIVESSALYAGSVKASPVVVPEIVQRPIKHATGKKNKRIKIVATHNVAPPSLLPQKVATGPEPIEQVKDALRELLQGMRVTSRVLLIDYGGDVTTHPPFRAPGAVLSEIDDVQPDDESGDLHLVDALQSAMMELKRLHEKSAGRSLIVVVSDGLNSQMDRTIFRRLGDAANVAQAPIYSLAFSPADDRGPLLNLGELSKRSHGTFRWAKTGADLHTQVQTLIDELNQQYLLTFHVDARSLQGATLTLVSDGLASNTVKLGNDPRLARPLWTSPIAIAISAAILLLLAIFAWQKFRGGAIVASTRASRVAPVAAIHPALHIVSGTLSGQRVVLGDRAIILGGDAGTTQLVDDPAVSSRHAQVANVRGAFELTDLGSTNGTFVNNARISKTLLRDGDLIRIGNTQLKFRLEG